MGNPSRGVGDTYKRVGDRGLGGEILKDIFDRLVMQQILSTYMVCQTLQQMLGNKILNKSNSFSHGT